jgi:hypothetical protein
MKTETRLYPPNYMRAITGVAYITGSGAKTTLHYIDGTTETGKHNPIKDGNDFLNIVSAIQSQRK